MTPYPGWYAGRTPHIHIKIRAFAGQTAFYTFNTRNLFSNETVTGLV